jgi:hypothetical protein
MIDAETYFHDQGCSIGFHYRSTGQPKSTATEIKGIK